MKTEDLNKSIDVLIDELFAEPIAKADMIKDANPAKETADEVMKQVPKAEDDASRNAGRPKQISDVPKTDTDGSRDGNYDGSIAAKQEDAKKPEDSQVAVPTQLKKSLSDSEWDEYQAFKAAKAQETLQKAKLEQVDLIKSAVAEVVAPLKSENADLRKALAEQADLIKAIADAPQRSKAVTNVQAVEKFQKSQSSSNRLSKSEVLDVAEELVKSGKLSMENCIEIENSGFLFDPEARSVLEKEIARRYR